MKRKNNITTSCAKCIVQAQKNPFVSLIDFDRNQPMKPAISAPAIPLGAIPK